MTLKSLAITKVVDRSTLASVWPPTGAVAGQAGHRPMSPIQAIRRKCLDCSGQQLAEVKLCETVTCALWPLRAGRHPYTGKGLQETEMAQRPPEGLLVPRSCPFIWNWPPRGEFWARRGNPRRRRGFGTSRRGLLRCHA